MLAIGCSISECLLTMAVDDHNAAASGLATFYLAPS